MSIDRRTFIHGAASTSAAAAALVRAGYHVGQAAESGKIKFGQIGTKHAHAAGKISTARKFPDLYEVVGVVEPDDEQWQAVANRSAYKDAKRMTQEELLNTPGLKVVMPASPHDAKGLLISAIRDPDPVIFFEPKRIYRAFREETPEDEYTIPIGQAKVVEEGEHVTVVSWGAMVVDCLKAMDELPEDLSVELIDLRTIYPLDIDCIVESVKKTGRCVVVHEAPKTAGFGAEITAQVMEHCFLHLEAPVQRVAGFDTFMPYYKLELEYLPSVERIAEAIGACAAY